MSLVHRCEVPRFFEKTKVWKEIIDSVKARVGGEKSSVEQIKEKWRKACSTAKLEVAVNRKSLNQTGGGPALPAPSGVTQKNLGTSHRCILWNYGILFTR
jgi:hypothetical protein